MFGSLSGASGEQEIAGFGFQGDYVFEAVQPAVARALGATTTTTIFLRDSDRRLRYRGAIDDPYGLDRSAAQFARKSILWMSLSVST